MHPLLLLLLVPAATTARLPPCNMQRVNELKAQPACQLKLRGLHEALGSPTNLSQLAYAGYMEATGGNYGTMHFSPNGSYSAHPTRLKVKHAGGGRLSFVTPLPCAPAHMSETQPLWHAMQQLMSKLPARIRFTMHMEYIPSMVYTHAVAADRVPLVIASAPDLGLPLRAVTHILTVVSPERTHLTPTRLQRTTIIGTLTGKVRLCLGSNVSRWPSLRKECRQYAPAGGMECTTRVSLRSGRAVMLPAGTWVSAACMHTPTLGVVLSLSQ